MDGCTDCRRDGISFMSAYVCVCVGSDAGYRQGEGPAAARTDIGDRPSGWIMRRTTRAHTPTHPQTDIHQHTNPSAPSPLPLSLFVSVGRSVCVSVQLQGVLKTTRDELQQANKDKETVSQRNANTHTHTRTHARNQHTKPSPSLFLSLCVCVCV